MGRRLGGERSRPGVASLESGVAVCGERFLRAFCAADGLRARSGSARAAGQGQRERHGDERTGTGRGYSVERRQGATTLPVGYPAGVGSGQGSIHDPGTAEARCESAGRDGGLPCRPETMKTSTLAGAKLLRGSAGPRCVG